MADDPTYRRFKQLCLALPGTQVTITWGEPHMRVGAARKIFTGWSASKDGARWSFSVKVDKDKQAAMVASDPRFTVAPYVGKHGWVTMTVETGDEDWGEIEALVEEGYRNVAPARLSALIGGTPPRAPRRRR